MSKCRGRWGQLLQAASLLAFVSCTDSQVSLFIRQAQAIEAPQCTPSSEINSKVLLEGRLDVGLRQNYLAILLVGGQLKDVGNNDLNRGEANRISVTSAEVTVKSTAGDTLSKYMIPVNGFVDPAKGATFSTGLVGVRLVDFSAADFAAAPSIVDTLQKKGGTYTLVARVQVFGETLGGTKLSSNYFDFPIQVCYGCSVAYAAGTVSSDVNGPNCAQASDAPNVSSFCNPGQDSLIDCRDCGSLNPTLCRSTK